MYLKVSKRSITSGSINGKANITRSRSANCSFLQIKNSQDLTQAIETLGYPFIVKTRFGGYDGKGQILVKQESDIQEAMSLVKIKNA